MPLRTHDTPPDAGDFLPLGAPVRHQPPAPAAGNQQPVPVPVPGKPGFVTLPDGRLGTALPLATPAAMAFREIAYRVVLKASDGLGHEVVAVTGLAVDLPGSPLRMAIRETRYAWEVTHLDTGLLIGAWCEVMEPEEVVRCALAKLMLFSADELAALVERGRRERGGLGGGGEAGVQQVL
jgi:hypothetical protein